MMPTSHKLLLPALLLCPLLSMAQKWDYQWPMGYWYGSVGGLPDIALLDFTGDTVALYGHAYSDHLGFGSSASAICDGEGQLALTTNNCGVFDQDFLLVPGSDTLTPGWGFDNYCDVQSQSVDGYIGKQITLFLPEMGNDSVVYLAHKDNILVDSFPVLDVLSTKLYLSTLVRKPDGSHYLKEKRKLAQGFYNFGRLTACLHADGERWWVNMVEHNSNRFDWFLVGGQDTVQGPFVQEIGSPLLNQDIDIGQVAFSPDASMLAFNSGHSEKIYLYGFDNATGQLSDPQEVSYPVAQGEHGLGIAFSFDSRFVYTTTNTDLYQIDLQDGNSVEHIAHHASLDENHWPVVMGNLYLGPDCRMYVSPGSTTYYLHVVHRPNEKGAACGFEARALRSPSNINVDLPNLPMYRFGGACDSTIAFPYRDTVSASVELLVDGNVEVFPNPMVDYFTVSFTGQVPLHARLLLFDGLGRPQYERPLPAINNVFGAEGLAPGIYFYRIMDGERLLQSGKLVKVE